MYMWYVWEEHCEFVYSVSYASPGRRPKPVKRKHGRHCLKWLREIDAISMNDLTSINRVIAGGACGKNGIHRKLACIRRLHIQ